MSHHRLSCGHLALHDNTTGFSIKVLTDSGSNQPLVGIISAKITEFSVKLLTDFEKSTPLVLCSSLFTSFEVDSSGTLVQRFNPLKLLHLKGKRNDVLGFNVTIPELFFEDVKIASFWLQDYDRAKKDNVELTVLFFTRQAL